MPSMLGVEYPHGVTHSYRPEHELAAFENSLRTKVQSDPSGCTERIVRGERISVDAGLYLDGNKHFGGLQEISDFLVDAYVHSNIFPYFFLKYSEELGLKDTHADLVARAEKLRSVPVFQPMYEKFFLTLGMERLQALGFLQPNVIQAITAAELLQSDTSHIQSRLADIAAGKYFVYESNNGSERVEFVDNPRALLAQHAKESTEEMSELRGESAFGGRAEGIVRLVFSADGKGGTFNDGDILVSPSTSTGLVDLIRRCSAIVTDEGGTMSHAAILAREFGKPCIVGTRRATETLKEGDMVEVDADKGVVRILNKSPER